MPKIAKKKPNSGRKRGYDPKGGNVIDTLWDTGKMLFGKTKGEMHDNVSSFDNNRKFHADFADSAYKGTGKVSGFSRLKEYSNKDVHVYKDPKRKRAIIAFRGTQFGKSKVQSIRDIVHDVSIFKNATNPRVAADQAVVEKFLKENPGIKVSTTGHSLGAFSSSMVFHNLSKKKSYKGRFSHNYAFNPGISTYGGLSWSDPPNKAKWKSILKDPRHKFSVVEGDPVSRSINAYFDKNKSDVATIRRIKGGIGLGNHSMAHFLRK